MNYIKITKNDIANGPGVRTVLWVSGCSHCCQGCQNSHTWDPSIGTMFDHDAKLELLESLNSPYKSGLTLSGGDPLYRENIDEIYSLVKMVRGLFPEKSIWLYTGYTWEEIHADVTDKMFLIMSYIDVLIDGEFVEARKNISLPYCGSDNQRVIDVQASLNNLHNDPVIWTTEGR